jgi:hypothetical protein
MFARGGSAERPSHDWTRDPVTEFSHLSRFVVQSFIHLGAYLSPLTTISNLTHQQCPAFLYLHSDALIANLDVICGSHSPETIRAPISDVSDPLPFLQPPSKLLEVYTHFADHDNTVLCGVVDMLIRTRSAREKFLRTGVKPAADASTSDGSTEVHKKRKVLDVSSERRPPEPYDNDAYVRDDASPPPEKRKRGKATSTKSAKPSTKPAKSLKAPNTPAKPSTKPETGSSQTTLSFGRKVAKA